MTKRRRKLSGYEFLILMMLGQTASHYPSLTTLTSLISNKLSKQALHKWFTEEAVVFLRSIFAYICKIKLQQIQVCKSLEYFSAILVCDSTWWELTKSLKLENFFKMFGGKYSKTPQCKLQLLLNFTTGSIMQADITKSTANDPTYHKTLLDFMIPKSLLIVDLGYFSVKFFSKINTMGAFFLSRLKFGTCLFSLETGEKLNPLKIMKKSGENEFEFKALLAKEKLESRIIVSKVPKDVAKKRRNKYKDTCRRKKRKICTRHIEQLGWSLFVTNLPEKIVPASQIILLYSIRWQIELIIKTLKTTLSIDFTTVRTNVNRILAEIYGRLILAAFLAKAHYIANEISSNESEVELSFDKFFKTFRDRTFKLTELFLESTRKGIEYIYEVLQLCFSICHKERRKTRPSSREKLLQTSCKPFVRLSNCFIQSLS